MDPPLPGGRAEPRWRGQSLLPSSRRLWRSTCCTALPGAGTGTRSTPRNFVSSYFQNEMICFSPLHKALWSQCRKPSSCPPSWRPPLCWGQCINPSYLSVSKTVTWSHLLVITSKNLMQTLNVASSGRMMGPLPEITASVSCKMTLIYCLAHHHR